MPVFFLMSRAKMEKTFNIVNRWLCHRRRRRRCRRVRERKRRQFPALLHDDSLRNMTIYGHKSWQAKRANRALSIARMRQHTLRASELAEQRLARTDITTTTTTVTATTTSIEAALEIAVTGIRSFVHSSFGSQSVRLHFQSVYCLVAYYQ